ncbi:MAG TPA: ATP-binding protein [Flavobacteriales bacterium]|nr:ATP-binding protein [Flavobacteriales bacterium]
MGKPTVAPPRVEDPDEKLRERIKELGCLYAVARIAQTQDLGLEPMLVAVVRTIPQGWQRPDDLWVALELDGQHYGTNGEHGPRQQQAITIDGEARGLLSVGYRTTQADNAAPIFLSEEEQLLEKLANEVATIVERQEKRERQRLFEARMVQQDRLNVLGELTAGIAHELNTPLGNVLGYAELLKANEADPARREDLQRIIDSALIGREVVKRLMYFSCEMPSQFRVQDVNTVVEGTMNLLKRQVEGSRVELHMYLAPGLPHVRLDRVQFEQVLTNLVMNALHAMGAGGQLDITTEAHERLVHIRVRDSGHGIEATQLRKIFQPFFTTKPTGEGTGLGLSVVHGIIKAHGGDITVESTLGQGTSFTITLPLA